MPIITTRITNLQIIEKVDKNGDEYFVLFVVVKEKGDNAFLAFPGRVKEKEGWNDLFKHWKDIKEVEIEWEEDEKGKKILNIWCNIPDNIFIY